MLAAKIDLAQIELDTYAAFNFILNGFSAIVGIWHWWRN